MEKRKRDKTVVVRLYDEELAALNRDVAKTGCSREQYLRLTMMMYRPREKPPADFAGVLKELSRILPEAHFVGEEEGQEIFLPEYGKGFTFVVDPIDGTSNFMRDYELSVTSIALLKDGRPYIGVIYNPYADRIFYAEKGCGAFENGRQIFTSPDPLSHSLVSMGTAPYYADEITHSAFEIGNWYLKRSIDIRRSGSAAWDLCLIASGRTGLFYEPLLCLWDYAAGACILEEAGGTITDMHGEILAYRGKSSILAVTAGVAKEDYLPPVELMKE